MHTHKNIALPIVGIALVLVSFLAYGTYRYLSLEKRHYQLEERVAVALTDLKLQKERLAKIDSELGVAVSDGEQLSANLREQAEKSRSIKGQLENISSTVGTLEKLAKTDPELLQKYSKVFFLNENYEPARLTEIPKPNLYSEKRTERISTQVWPYLQRLLEDALDQGVTIYVKSAFRSFNEQSNIKSAYTVRYGSGTANQFSADQGYSEHQLGTTVDFITTGLNGQLSGFEMTDAYTWLKENAYKYGFVISYPKGNTFYVFEPWHWRFVGTKLANKLHDDKKLFYDLDQRDIDTYLSTLFD